MNRYLLERILWDLVSAPPEAAAFRDDPARFLGRYRLGEAEAGLLRNLDVQALLTLGINPMLVMRAFQMVHGRDQLPKYLERLRAG